ncbi:AAA family ATPase [Acidithiobacillus thiooxidans]|uniref:AAA family ATPase n=1 Tax=Acidithiobacillus thiooxidans TaxID=930 RepID=UPI0035B6A876
MDEPENHLHPSAVIDLLDAIKEQNPHGQIWIATHSIPLLSHYDEGSIWYVDEGSISFAGRKPELSLPDYWEMKIEYTSYAISLAFRRSWPGTDSHLSVCNLHRLY